MDFGVVHCCSRCGAPLGSRNALIDCREPANDCQKHHANSFWNKLKVGYTLLCSWVAHKFKYPS